MVCHAPHSFGPARSGARTARVLAPLGCSHRLRWRRPVVSSCLDCLICAELQDGCTTEKLARSLSRTHTHTRSLSLSLSPSLPLMHHNLQDGCTTEKLAQGIRAFVSDTNHQQARGSPARQALKLTVRRERVVLGLMPLWM